LTFDFGDGIMVFVNNFIMNKSLSNNNHLISNNCFLKGDPEMGESDKKQTTQLIPSVKSEPSVKNSNNLKPWSVQTKEANISINVANFIKADISIKTSDITKAADNKKGRYYQNDHGGRHYQSGR
jgi:hypothetical protein